MGCSVLVFSRETALCPTARGQGTLGVMHRLSYKCLGSCYDLRDTVRVKPSLPHDIALHID